VEIKMKVEAIEEEKVSTDPKDGTPFFTESTLIAPETPPGEWAAVYFGVGKFGFSTVTVDNQDFDQLVGEAIDTDIGTYTIESSAHTDGQFQLLQENVPIQTIWIYSITGLTAI
jgi:hypothetical protein